jgi:hypothetical protein
MASGQATPLYDGPVIDTARYARYAGTYELDPEYRSPARHALQIVWDGALLVAMGPLSRREYLFLNSPSEPAASVTEGKLHFTLGPDGNPIGAWLEVNGSRLWNARRTSP